MGKDTNMFWPAVRGFLLGWAILGTIAVAAGCGTENITIQYPVDAEFNCICKEDHKK